VMCAFPIRMIVAGTELGDAQGSREGDCARHVSRGSTCA
jgi:hypothetical protein